jgi:hypothetical protein
VRRRGSARGKTRPPAPAFDDRVDSRPRRIRNEQARSRYSKRSGDPCAIDAALLRARGAGPTLIVSPLLALMRNQIDAANRAGIHAATINSSNLADWHDIYDRVQDGAVDVLLVSPERLNHPGFRDYVLPELAKTTGLLVVDEAHCISDWGHDFRPDYRRIRRLLAELSPHIPVLATTATANSRVVTDVAEQLGDADVLRGTLDRESLRLAVLSLPSHVHRLAWLADHLDDLAGSGIIYTVTVLAAESTASFLRSWGHSVLPDEIIRAALEVINGWTQQENVQPVAIVGMSSRQRSIEAPSQPQEFRRSVGYHCLALYNLLLERRGPAKSTAHAESPHCTPTLVSTRRSLRRAFRLPDLCCLLTTSSTVAGR